MDILLIRNNENTFHYLNKSVEELRFIIDKITFSINIDFYKNDIECYEDLKHLYSIINPLKNMISKEFDDQLIIIKDNRYNQLIKMLYMEIKRLIFLSIDEISNDLKNHYNYFLSHNKLINNSFYFNRNISIYHVILSISELLSFLILYQM